MLAAHDAVTTNSTKAQQKLCKLVNQGRHAAHTALLDQLREMSRPQGPRDPLGRCETKALAKARYRSLQGAGATACLRARPTDSLRVIPAAEFVGMGRRFLEIEEHVAVRCLCCNAINVDTRHARSCTSSRDLPHFEAAQNSTPSGERRTVHCGKEPAYGCRHQARKSSRRSKPETYGQVHPTGRHPCRPASAGKPARRQC